ncbi:MAG: VOC family protein [Actinomycetota bacterium]|nr:VOC family protein [Actinomycetota bacterium]
MLATIDPRTSVGPVTLTVRDVERMRDFYERVLGLDGLDEGEGRTVLGAGERPLVELVEDRDAPPRPRGATGLFHLALLVPDRAELARSLQRLIETRWPLQGASDHLVSEALYVGDPEGNGIEIYRDRPRDEWQRDGGEMRMATLPLDLDDVLAELGSGEGTPGTLPPGTRMGHVHLNVAELAASEAFYAGLLGLDVTARDYPGALFLSAGGYHHHIGLNTWRGEGAPPPPPDALGLRAYELVVPDISTLEDTLTRLREGGAEVELADSSFAARDPSGNRLRLVVAD